MKKEIPAKKGHHDKCREKMAQINCILCILYCIDFGILSHKFNYYL